MVKYVSIFRLKPGFNRDESYQLWQDVHAPKVKERLSGLLRKYKIAKVVSAPEAKPDFFGMCELSFDNLNTAKRGIKKVLPEAFVPPDPFLSRIADVRRVFVVEEKDMSL